MANRLKEDEKNERIIRGLLKLPENRKCINCNSLGPQYVCTNFWTFVCTNCSGIHREFTHRVKSISMAKFTSQEVSSLQEGGNQRAKEIYFKEWDPQRQSFPDSSNVDRLRDFIKHVYVDRRYSGERNFERPPRGKMGDKEDLYDKGRIDSFQGGSRSPPYEDVYDRRYGDRSSPGGRSYDERRSPGYDQESRQFNDYKRSPGRPRLVNDWRRDDRFGNGKRFEDCRMSDGDNKLEGQLPEQSKDLDSSSPPGVRPVRDILRDNVVPLRISEPPKANVGRATDGSAHTQRTASSNSLGSTNENPPEVKLGSTGSLIDFDDEPEPPVAATVSQAPQTTAAQSVVQPANATDDNNWASFDVSTAGKSSQVPSNANTLESVLSQLSIPASVHSQSSGTQIGTNILTSTSAGSGTAMPASGAPGFPTVGHAPTSFPTVHTAAATQASSFSAFPPSGAPWTMARVLPANGIELLGRMDQWPVMQQKQPLFPATFSESTAEPFTSPFVGGASNNQPWSSHPVPQAQIPPSVPPPQAPQVVLKPSHDTAAVIQSSAAEIKSSGRRELPEDLFTATYPSVPAQVPGWQMGPRHGASFPVQYNTLMPMPSLTQSSKSTNPFDLSSEHPVQVSTFPSMASVQGALPNISPSGLMHTSSLSAEAPAWMPPQSSLYGLALPPQVPSATTGAYMGQQLPTTMSLPRHQGLGGFGAEAVALGPSNSDKLFAGRFPAPATPNLFSASGGNPFG